MDTKELKKVILEKLKPLDLDKVVLFGSHAYGTPTKDSDVDLYVVTKDDFIPKSWKDRNELYLKVSKSIRDIRKNFAIDLIVHTKKMYEEFKKTNSNFYKHDISKGLSLL